MTNSYFHFKDFLQSVKKITKNATWRKVKKLNVEKGKITEVDIKAENDPVIQAAVKPIIDEKNVFDYFDFTKKVVEYLMSQSHE